MSEELVPHLHNPCGCTAYACMSKHPGMQGIEGEGYTRVLNGEAHSLPNDGTFYGSPDDYFLPSYFPKTALPQAHIAHKRVLASIRGPDQAEDGFLAAAAAHLDASALHVAHAGGYGHLVLRDM